VFPPVVRNLKYLLLHREVHSAMVTVFMPWYDTYMLTRDNTERYLMLLGVDFVDVNALLDYLWNFRAVVLSVPDGTYVGVSEEDLFMLAKQGVLTERSDEQFARVVREKCCLSGKAQGCFAL